MARKKTDATAEVAKQAEPEADRKQLARALLQPNLNAAAVMVNYGKPLGIKQEDIGVLIELLAEDVKDVWAGDMKRAEAMLFGQAHALQAIFMELARRATAQEYLKQWDAYMRMAMKAQNQCRMTLETLATIKNPPVVYARQANINHGGQQQVNNGAVPASGVPPTHAETSEAAPNGLLDLPQEAGPADCGRAGSDERAQPVPIQAGKAT